MASPGLKVPRTTKFGISARNTLKLVNTLVITELKAELETRNDDFNKLEDQVERLGKSLRPNYKHLT